ncbi:MAG TPA: SgcJ/EcaC family oxidoreductase [Bryobacteraceae bacterium]|nr:SgcJ/EcaC family oxidoreductase [Bryobacteraceae bacterium]
MKIGAALLCVQLLLAQDANPGSNDAAVREVVKRYADARGVSDPKAIGALFTDEADQLVSNGEWRRGREALVKGMLSSSARDTGKRILEVETIRYLGRDVAIADARYEIGERKMWSTFIMRRGSDGWRIEAIRNMLPTAPSTPTRGPQR